MKRFLSVLASLAIGVTLIALTLGSAGVQYPPLMPFRGVNYTWPASQGSANSILQNNGSGTLSWSSGATSGGNWSASGTTNSTLTGGSSQDNITVTNAATFSGNISQTGAKTFSSGTGTFTINGAATVASGKTLTVGSAQGEVNTSVLDSRTTSATGTSGSFAEIIGSVIVNPSASSSGNFYGLMGAARSSSSMAFNLTASPGLVGVQSSLIFQHASNTVTKAALFSAGTVSTNSGGAVTTLVGYFSPALNAGASAIDFDASGPSTQINNYTAFKAETPGSAPATTSYGFYSDTGQSNYFGGLTYPAGGLGGNILFDKTITAVGTTTTQTINKTSGRVNIAATGTSCTVNNNLVTTNSIIIAVPATADTTARVTSVVPGTGSFVINTVATTAETAFNWIVTN